MPEEYYSLLDQIEILENRCYSFENTREKICQVSETFRLFGDSQFADNIYHNYFLLQEQYEQDVKLLYKLKQNYRYYYKELN